MYGFSFGGHLFVINNIIQYSTAHMTTQFELDTVSVMKLNSNTNSK